MGHALTIRLPESTYQEAKKMAARKGISLSRLVQEALADKTASSASQSLEAAYDLLAEDAADCDVEGFFALQTEAILNG